MEYFEKDFGKILKNNAQTMRHNLLPEGTNCFRVYDRNLSQFPVTVDIYGKYAKVTDYGESEPMSDEKRTTCLDICSRMLYLEPDNIIYSYRAKREQGQQHEKTQTDALVVGVLENNLKFKVDLTTYVDTGLFLDHRLTRMLIRERSVGCDVLNLFSYTGSFSVYAAAGLAKSVKSVDLSATYTKWAQENLASNGYEGPSYECVCMDASKYVSDAISRNEKYDIIIFDPPCFSNSRKMDMDFDVARDYVDWIKNLAKLMKNTGILLFSTNLGTFRMDRRRLRGMSVKEITGAVEAPGFVRGRKGAARSWMMAFDDDSLKLDWSEPSEKSQKGSGEKMEKKDEKDASDKGSDDARKSRRNGDRSSGYGSYGRDRDGYRGSRESRGSREFGGFSRERSSRRDDDRRGGYREGRRDGFRDADRPSYGRDYSERRAYGRRDDRRNDYRPRYRQDDEDLSERRSFRDGGEERPRRDYSSDRGSGRSFRSDRSDRYERSDRPRFGRDNDRGFDKPNRYEGRDRSENRFAGRGEGRSYDSPRYERRNRDDYSGRRSSSVEYKGRGENRFEGFGSKPAKSAKKPYGFDSFRPARSRDDSSDFFWNSEDLDSKPKKED